MPRGNDSATAASELADEFGQGAGNAEALIEANNQAHSQDLVAAGMKQVNDEATVEALENLDSYSGPDGEEALDVSVRGRDETIVVYEDESGRVQKALVGDEDSEANGPESKSSSSGKSAKAKANAKAKADAAKAAE